MKGTQVATVPIEDISPSAIAKGTSVSTEVEQYIQFGCHTCAPETWLNFDSSPTLRLQRLPLVGKFLGRNRVDFPSNVRFGCVVSGLPVRKARAKAIYCSHVLEHLSLDDFRKAIRNCLTYLEPNGRFRFVLPDLEFLTQQYLSTDAPEASIEFMTASYLGVKQRKRGALALMESWLGNSSHLWMWDFKSMRRELEDAGFVNVRRASFGDCDDQKFEDVEAEVRWTNCLGVECFAPEKGA